MDSQEHWEDQEEQKQAGYTHHQRIGNTKRSTWKHSGNLPSSSKDQSESRFLLCPNDHKDWTGKMILLQEYSSLPNQIWTIWSRWFWTFWQSGGSGKMMPKWFRFRLKISIVGNTRNPTQYSPYTQWRIDENKPIPQYQGKWTHNLFRKYRNNR